MGPDWQDHGLVFPTEVGTPVHPSGMNRKLARVTERAGVGALVDDRAEPALGRLAPVR